MVEFRETPIDQSELTVGVVNHDVVRLDITVHDSLGVTVVKSFENLIHVEANVKIIEALVQLAEVSIACIDKLGDNCGSLG